MAATTSTKSNFPNLVMEPGAQALSLTPKGTLLPLTTPSTLHPGFRLAKKSSLPFNKAASSQTPAPLSASVFVIMDSLLIVQ